MSEKEDTNNNHDPMIQPFLEFWTNCLERANESAQAVFESNLGLGDNQTTQQNSFDQISKSLDAYLRSPDFLQAMKQRIDAIIQAKRTSNDQPSETIDATFTGNFQEFLERLNSTDLKILNRLETIEHRLSTIESHLNLDKIPDNESEDTQKDVEN